MPYKIMPKCKYYGCSNRAIMHNGGYCEEHMGIYLKEKSDKSSKYDKYVRKEHTERYGRTWQIIRKNKLAEEPFCEMCKKKNINSVATLVHHIKPLADGGTNDDDNLMSLCNKCHEEIHNKHGERFKRQ